MPSSRKKWSKTSGIRYHDGPVSKRKPSLLPACRRGRRRSSRCSSRSTRPAVGGQQRGGGQPGDPAADDDDAAGVRGSRRAPRGHGARATIRALAGPGHPDPAGCGSRSAGVRRSRRGQLGEQRVRAPRRRAGCRPAAGRSTAAAAAQVGVDVVEQRGRAARVVEPGGVDAGEVAAAQVVVVGGEVAQEVDLLERRAEAAGAGRERGVRRVGRRARRRGTRAGTSARPPRPSRRRSASKLACVVLGAEQVGAHRGEERVDQVGADAARRGRCGRRRARRGWRCARAPARADVSASSSSSSARLLRAWPRRAAGRRRSRRRPGPGRRRCARGCGPARPAAGRPGRRSVE